MIYEFCAENVTLLEKAMQSGARRIELCDNLAVGGTTPSYGAVSYTHLIRTWQGLANKAPNMISGPCSLRIYPAPRILRRREPG